MWGEREDYPPVATKGYEGFRDSAVTSLTESVALETIPVTTAGAPFLSHTVRPQFPPGITIGPCEVRPSCSWQPCVPPRPPNKPTPFTTRLKFPGTPCPGCSP